MLATSSFFPFLLLQLVLLLTPLHSARSSSISAAVKNCSEGDFLALLHFKESLQSSSLQTWNTSVSCCAWDGITCDGSSPARVVSISLPRRGIHGSIPPALANLTFLQALNLSYNALQGPIPKELAILRHLRQLDISSNNLSSNLLVLVNLQTLQEVNVSSNRFSDSLPSFQNFSSVLEFWVSNNSLTGWVPPDVCQYASHIEVLDLSSNNLTGPLLKGLGMCSSLKVLDLGDNNLQGPIPSDIYHLSSLTKLCLAKNSFTGTLEAAIGNLESLEYLMLGLNNLTGTLPANLSSCTKLKVFTANGNNLSGSLDMIQFNKLRLLESLDLNTNNFTGSIPSSLVECTALQTLNMAKNSLTGTIPSNLSGLQNLSTLLLSSNNLHGSLMALVRSTRLVSLILSKNPFNESLPNTLDGLSDLQLLALGNLHLHGRIPEWLRNCTKLQVLDLSWNNLEGPLPSWLGMFPHLFYLDLSNNSFAGNIPPELFKLPTLMHGDKNLTGLQTVVNNLAIKQESGLELKYTQVKAFPPSIYLSHNQLEGSIPSDVGGLAELLIMDLSYNKLNGSIPETMASMTDLEELDMSWNNLSGSIPLQLSKLTFLSSFKVAHNHLVGSIPQGNQFSTFSNKSYEGNDGLCGPPVSSSCQNKSKVADFAPFSKRASTTTRMAILVPTCLAISLIALLVTWLAWKLSRRNVVYQGSVSFKGLDGPQKNLEEALDCSVQLFCRSHGKLTVFDLFRATNSFDAANIVGCGGFGLVYRADLADGSKLAIKKLTGDCGQMEREFRAEVETLSKAQHKNLVPLLGYLQVGNDRLLLYSYMENGSLDYWLHERTDCGTCLEWPTRLKIAQGSAHGLAYLHQVCDPHVVHRDIKSSNILLDEKFQAHLADFGLARLMMSTDTHVTTEVVGTLGYIPPEYGHALNATPRGDIYSFGVVLLELLTRRRPVDICKGRAGSDLVAWVLQKRMDGKLEEIFDSVLLNKGHDEQMLQVLDVACPCVSLDPIKRPTISDVVNWLDQVGQEREPVKPVL